jgi:hypothetical protein
MAACVRGLRVVLAMSRKCIAGTGASIMTQKHPTRGRVQAAGDQVSSALAAAASSGRGPENPKRWHDN